MREYDDIEALRAAGHTLVDEAIRHLDRPLDAPVETLKTAAELGAAFGPPPAEGRPWRDVLAQLRESVVEESNRLAHPMYMGQQVCPPLPLPALADALVSMLNQSQAVFEMSPAGTMLEHELIRWFARLAFGDDGAGDALGSFVSGGSAGNMTGLLAARARAFPDAWAQGAPAGTVIITGAQAHYSVARAGGILGLGASNVIAAPTDPRHATDARALARALRGAIAEGRPVLAVVATSGSTATGSFDDLEDIGDACAEHGVWLHVDGAHGASALLSEKHRWRVRGLERADSLAWDPHKMMFQPLSTALVLVKEQRWLRAAFQQEAPYLFHAGKGTQPPPDMGSYTFQCSRRSDAVRLWLALEHYGTRRLGELYDHCC
ncbi:MAG TPA: pyridoxal-dependent decarboxylase, partial [Longimicrobiales bacterium]